VRTFIKRATKANTGCDNKHPSATMQIAGPKRFNTRRNVNASQYACHSGFNFNGSQRGTSLCVEGKSSDAAHHEISSRRRESARASTIGTTRCCMRSSSSQRSSITSWPPNAAEPSTNNQ